MNQEKILQAGKIASEIKKYIRPQIKKGVLLREIAEKIEDKIFELGGKPAFPTNLSINEIAAHYTPSHDDKTTASGILKIDFGAHVDGWISDTAFSINLAEDKEEFKENEKLISAAEEALKAAQERISIDVKVNRIGKRIQNTIESLGFIPIINLTGHEIDNYDLHSGLTIPNFHDSRNELIKPGLYAIEPFATLSTGTGRVYEGGNSGIYILQNTKNVRSPLAREVLEYIIKEYQTLPFCSRWIVKKFSTRGLFALRQLENNGNLYQYPQLIEASHQKVSQAENTIFLTPEGEKIITTE